MGTWTTKLRISVGMTAMLAAGVLPAVAADDMPAKQPSRQETIGVASGLTIGALAGGPFGAVIGAAAGAWLGDRFHRESSALETARARNNELNGRLMSLDSSLEGERARVTELASLLDRVHELETDVAFRTEDASLSPESVVKLHRLGTLLAGMPETRVRIAGFADGRGAEDFNLELSGRRAAAVVSELEKAGLPAERLIVEAHGESMASSVDGDVDAQALERRVTISVERGSIAVAGGGEIR